MTCQNETMKHSEMPAELKRRIEAERAVSALNPNRRGPKPKKPSSSGHAADCR